MRMSSKINTGQKNIHTRSTVVYKEKLRRKTINHQSPAICLAEIRTRRFHMNLWLRLSAFVFFFKQACKLDCWTSYSWLHCASNAARRRSVTRLKMADNKFANHFATKQAKPIAASRKKRRWKHAVIRHDVCLLHQGGWKSKLEKFWPDKICLQCLVWFSQRAAALNGFSASASSCKHKNFTF